MELFEEEAIYYGRWREFRGETKHAENELEDVEEEELAEELDLFAVSDTDDVFKEAFLVRCVMTTLEQECSSADWIQIRYLLSSRNEYVLLTSVRKGWTGLYMTCLQGVANSIS